MCSVEDGNELIEMKIKPVNRCRRCNEKAVMVHGKDSLCRECFLAYCTHKFRGTLGKSKQIKRGEKILIAFSGGMSSSAMLHMIKEGLREASHKKLSFYPVLLFIDESSIFPTECKNEEIINNEIYKILLDSEFPAYISQIEMIYCDEKNTFYHSLNDQMHSVFDNYTREKKLLLDALDCFKSLSCKEDFIKNIRYKLIVNIAKHIDCTKIFVGESATWLAVQLLSSLSQGRGANISDETSFIDGRYIIPILRPMREFLSKEIAMYNHFLNIPFQIKCTLSTKADFKASILRLTENFVVGLQSQFPATVSTIYRIGNKLCPDSERICEEKCILCQSYIDTTNSEECSALRALKLSEKLCQKLQNQDNCQISNNCCCKKGKDNSDCLSESRIDFIQYLCYSCQITVKEMKNQNLLPSSILLDAKQKLSRNQMKEKIKDFLLNDED